MLITEAGANLNLTTKDSEAASNVVTASTVSREMKSLQNHSELQQGPKL